MDENEIKIPQEIDEKLDKQLDKQWETLGISNDFIFSKVMQDKELMTELIHRILPDLSFTDIMIIVQKSEEEGMDSHGVRFDVFVKDETGRVIDIEMQVLNTGDLPLRMRYYRSVVDTQMLGKGESYSKLKESYIIMICPFDPFGQGRHFYSFTGRCDQDHDLLFGDKTMSIVLNAVGTMDDISDKLRAFLDYIIGKTSKDEFIQKLEEAVQKARANKEWRYDYKMTMMRDLLNQDIGEERGRKKRDREKIEEMLRKGKTPEDIVDFCGYPLELVKSVQNSMKAQEESFAVAN